MTFSLRSDDFEDGGKLSLPQALDGWGHEGQNISPHLAWSGAPEGTKSFVLTMFDPTPAAVSTTSWRREVQRCSAAGRPPRTK